MNQPQPFSIDHYEQLLVMLYDASHTIDDASTERRNAILMEITIYIQDHPLTAKDFLAIKGLLTHPKRGVRSVASIELLNNGYLDAWPTLIATAKPTGDGPIRTKEEGRDDSASYFARLYLMLNQAKYDQMGLKPSFDEAQEQWIAAGLIRRRMPRLPASITATKP